jgi:hypothetical protein
MFADDCLLFSKNSPWRSLFMMKREGFFGKSIFFFFFPSLHITLIHQPHHQFHPWKKGKGKKKTVPGA